MVGRVSRVCGIVVAFLILTLVGYLLVQMVLPQLTESIKTVTMNLPTYYTNAESWLRQIFHDNIQLKGYVDQIVAEVYSQLTVWLREELPAQVQTLVVTAISSGVMVFRTLFNLLIGLIVSIYILLDGICSWRRQRN